MEGSWWKERKELDDDQEAIIKLPPDGRYLLVGPPGCGKTNLLVLRAAFLYKAKFKNLAFITFTTGLADFIRTGVKGIDRSQVHSYLSWARSHALGLVPEHRAPIVASKKFQDLRKAILIACEEANKKVEDSNHLQAILLDEVQDLSASELNIVNALSGRITLAGDTRQSVYDGDAIERAKALGFETHTLRTHYRIGRAIARVADRIFEPTTPEEGLLATSNYDEKKLQSDAQHIACKTRDEQFQSMLARLRAQLKAYPKELIGILIGRTHAFDELRELFEATDIKDEVAFHDMDGVSFSDETRIHVLTIKAAKGTEFRAVHIFGCEDVQFRRTRRSTGTPP